jgi:hypothetical protein
MMVPFDVVNAKLNFQPTRGTGSYWYSLLAGTAQCLDTSPFSHLTFKITARPGDDFNVGMDSMDPTCTTFLPKRTVRVSAHTAEGRLTGAEQIVEIPLELLTENRRNVQSVFFNGFSATPGLFIMGACLFVAPFSSADLLTRRRVACRLPFAISFFVFFFLIFF